MILVDFSQVILATIFVSSKDFEADPSRTKDIIRHITLTSLLGYQKKFHEYGEIVVACDGHYSWRKKVFPHYKANRKKNRDSSPLDWNLIFETIAEVKEDLKSCFPWRVIDLPETEGDDVIAIMTKHVVDTRVVQDGLYETNEPVLIVSSDGDMTQLSTGTASNVKQWNPTMKKLVPPAPKDYLLDKIIRGDSGDGVPSVLCPDDWFVNSAYDNIRAKPVTQAVISRFKSGIGLDDEEMRRFERNRELISFEYIPARISDKILSTYNEIVLNKDLNKTFKFLMANNCTQLLERVQEFKYKEH